MARSLFNRTNAQGEMSFVDHLEALRWHIIRSLLVIIAMAIIIFIKIDWVFDRVILGPIQKDFITYTGLCNFGRWIRIGDSLCMPPVNVPLQANTFGTQFMTAISIAFMGGFIAAFPYVFWELWRFVKPALTEKELKSTRGSIFWVSFFFFLGTAFGYFLLAPFTYSFLANFQLGSSGIMKTIPTLADYIENLTDILIGSALAFQLPIVSFVLTRIGLITPSFLKNYRKYAYVAILVIAAIITPSPDWTSQMIVTIPLVLLYELSIGISNRVYKKEQKKWEEWE